jgi:hypothetical protein
VRAFVWVLHMLPLFIISCQFVCALLFFLFSLGFCAFRSIDTISLKRVNDNGMPHLIGFDDRSTLWLLEYAFVKLKNARTQRFKLVLFEDEYFAFSNFLRKGARSVFN